MPLLGNLDNNNTADANSQHGQLSIKAFLSHPTFLILSEYLEWSTIYWEKPEINLI